MFRGEAPALRDVGGFDLELVTSVEGFEITADSGHRVQLRAQATASAG